jgi:hypothetical protein
MNAGRPVSPEPLGALAEGDELIGVALLAPIPPGSVMFAMAILRVAMWAGVRAKGIEPCETGGLFGTGFTLWTMSTQDRNPALRAVLQTIKELGLLELCEVAFYDRAEAYWRTIHPYGAAPFDRFLSEVNIKTALQQVHTELAAAQARQKALKSAAQRQEGEGS